MSEPWVPPFSKPPLRCFISQQLALTERSSPDKTQTSTFLQLINSALWTLSAGSNTPGQPCTTGKSPYPPLLTCKTTGGKPAGISTLFSRHRRTSLVPGKTKLLNVLSSSQDPQHPYRGGSVRMGAGIRAEQQWLNRGQTGSFASAQVNPAPEHQAAPIAWYSFDTDAEDK